MDQINDSSYVVTNNSSFSKLPVISSHSISRTESMMSDYLNKKLFSKKVFTKGK